MRKDLKIGLLVGMVLVIGIVMMVSMWPGQGIEERQQKMFQEADVHLPIGINRAADETTMEKSDVTEKVTEADKPTVKAPAAIGLKKQVRIHTVSNGETLSSIALEYYGSSEYTQKIIDANRNALSNPDRIRAGTRLVIPSP